MPQIKRQQEIEWYKQELEDAENSRILALQNGLSAHLRGDVKNVFLYRAMVDSISKLIERLHQNTIALMDNDKVYLVEQCYSDNTHTLYAPMTCQASEHCHETNELIVTQHGLICQYCYQDYFDENIID